MALVLFLLSMGVASGMAQEISIVDAARQTRAKPKKARVITDDDLPRRAPEAAPTTPAGSAFAKAESGQTRSSVTPNPNITGIGASTAAAEHDDSIPCPPDLVQQLREQQASLNSSLQELQARIPTEEDGDKRRKFEGVAKVTAEQIELVRKQLVEAEKNVAKPVKGCPGAQDKTANNKAGADRPKQ
ncbi:MAG: hypothetical protein JOY79_03895 [Acidobacteriaceae bacterium]|nr:hypothetical protein [Acidobacteriaceae bacterium]